jgi:hypothetical protein
MNPNYLMPTKTLIVLSIATTLLSACTARPDDAEQWLAGDHHIHSKFSTGWDLTTVPPAPVIGGDAIYATQKNAEMARKFGLSWMVTTDHGGPNHSKLNKEQAYPELLNSRKDVPDVIQFYGMELNTPAGEHNSLIIPFTDDEADVLEQLESGFDRLEAFPLDPARNTEHNMLEALRAMEQLKHPPVVIANHPSRTADDYGNYGLVEPKEFRAWNDAAPNVAVGMEGAPGHQIMGLSSNPKIPDEYKARGAYGKFPTMGGFDQMTAVVGGFWDSMLGEGRHWWITANSDSHIHVSEGGIDLWPGEYSKTYVYAQKNHQSILENLRAGRMFVTTGDLIDALDFTISVGDQTVMMGEPLIVDAGTEVTVSFRYFDPQTENAHGDNPQVKRVDVIAGSISGPVTDPGSFENKTASVIKRFTATGKPSDELTFTFRIDTPTYFRLRGTNTDELEPEKDPKSENPWNDLWFYSNPIFVLTR